MEINMARHRFNKKRYFLMIILTAIILAVTALFVIWLSGYRMVKYETEGHGVIRFIGKVDKKSEPFRGKMYFSDGTTARLEDGSEITYSNGDFYQGEIDSLMPHGEGNMVFAGGDKFEGDFRYGYPHGNGTFTYANGDVYVGALKYGKKHGYGTYTWAADLEGQSDCYKGEFKDNLKWGEGTYTWADGSVYEGTYVADSKNGQGIIKFSNGDSYEGDFYQDRITGFGSITFNGSDRPDYTGYFENGVIVRAQG